MNYELTLNPSAFAHRLRRAMHSKASDTISGPKIPAMAIDASIAMTTAPYIIYFFIAPTLLLVP